jgi:hypothetical protein
MRLPCQSLGNLKGGNVHPDFPAKQAKANAKYYSSKGKSIYSDFSTFAQGKALAKCNSIEFCRDFSKHAAPVVVCEYGIGKGDFAKNFLDEIKKRDKQLYSKTRYYLFDISEKMLDAARKNLQPHKSSCTFGLFDASANLPSLPFDYCRINELLSDLPAEIYSKEDAPADFFARKFLERIDKRRKIPFNFTAQNFLLQLCKLGKPNFRFDIFDYGFYAADDIFSHSVSDWNRVVSRKYSSQITVDLNFFQLISALKTQGVEASIEKQKAYAEKILATPLQLSHTKAGLDYVQMKSKGINISEDDGFYHLRVGR